MVCNWRIAEFFAGYSENELPTKEVIEQATKDMIANFS